ncbi:DUF302 domain-containing protein [Thiolapillus sp.]
MKKLLIAGVLVLLALPLAAAEGLKVIVSSHDVAATTDRLEKIVTDAGFRVIARVNHGKAAAGVGIDLKPVELLIFGKPKAGSLLMQSQPSVAIDLPMKFLIWEDADGRVNIGWNDPAWITARHGIGDKGKLVEKMSGVLRKLATRGAGSD